MTPAVTTPAVMTPAVTMPAVMTPTVIMRFCGAAGRISLQNLMITAGGALAGW
jgi:hypothetical protein